MADLSEGSKLCTNCQQKINLANFLIHESFCLRNIVPCEHCKKPINKNQKDEHFQEYHVKVKCECGDLIEKINLDTHKQETCRKRQGNCFYCELSLDFDKLEEHIEFCGSRTEKCPKCNQYIKAKDQSKHDSTKCAYPPQPVQPAQQQQQHGPSQANLFRYQSNQATNNNYQVPTYSNENLIQRAHSIETRSFKRELSDDQVSLSMLPCEFCSEFYLSGELIDHQNSCPLNPILFEEASVPIDMHLNGLLNRNLNINEPGQLLRTLNNPLNRDMFQMMGLNTNPLSANRNQNPLENETYMDYMTDDEDEINEIADVIPTATSQTTTSNHNDINSNKIPCELCDELVEFEDWEVHQLTCKYSADTLDASRSAITPILAQYDQKYNVNQGTKPEIKASNQNPSKESGVTSSSGILKNSKQLPFAKEAAASVSSLKPALKTNGTTSSITNNSTNGGTRELGSVKTFNASTRPAGSKLFESNQPRSSATSVTSNSSKPSTDSKINSSKLNGFQSKK